MSKPLVSVILSVYNGAPYLKEAIESILNQTFIDFEFIIVDDGSIDETPKILDEFTDIRIVSLKNEKNLGLVRSLNKALSLAKGEFIARMDADDISLPERFAKQIAYFKKYPQVGVLGTAISQVDKCGRPISVLIPPIHHNLIFWQMFFGCPIFHPTVMMRQKALDAVGYYDINFTHIEDVELWSRFLLNGIKFANLSEVLHVRRLHNRSIISTQSVIQHQRGIIIRQRLLKSFLGYAVPADIVAWFLRFDRPLSRGRQVAILDLLLELHDKIVQVDSVSIEEKESLQTDLDYRITLVNQSWPRFLLRRLILYLGKILPVPSRHKLKIFLSKYLKRFLLQK